MSTAGLRGPREASWLRNAWPLWALIIASACLVLGALVLAGASPGQALWDLVRSSLGSASAISGTLREVTPLLLCGCAVYLGLRAGLFNIGVEGQFTVGALAAAVIAIRVPGSPGVLAATAGGMAMGGLWALPAAAIKAYRGGHEVITTIMLNSVAGLLTTALVAGPLKPPGEQSPQTAQIPSASYLPDLVHIGQLHVGGGLVLGVLLAACLGIWLNRSVAGYELRAVGANPVAAQFAGIDRRRIIMRSLVWSGAIGGLGGAVQVLSFQHYFLPGLSSGYGFDALGVALLAGSIPLALAPSSLLFGLLSQGGTAIQVNDQVPKGLISVIVGLIIVIAAAMRYRRAVTGE